jgi:hypothetical protein
VDGTYDVGWQGDDGGYFEFLTPASAPVPQFTRLVANAVNQAVITSSSEGNPNARIQLSAGGGNTRTIGEVALTAGTYPVRGVWFEGSGGSYFEVLGSTAGGEGRAYNLLLRNGANFAVTDFHGLQIVPASPIVIDNVGLMEQGGQQVFFFEFNVVPYASYDVEKTTDPTAWPGETTTLTAGPSDTKLQYSAPLDQIRAFFRVRRR